MPWPQLVEGLLLGFVIATITAPVGVSGAVFLLPVQLDILHVPNPAVTPTNLMYNVVAGPGAVLQYRRAGQLTGPLARLLMAGTVPGVVVGAIVRVYLLPGPQAFRLVAAAVLLPIGVWLIKQAGNSTPVSHRSRPDSRITALALLVGVVGGVYGIGGGSILAPILVGSGMSVALVAPAALAATFVTSLVGATTYALLSLQAAGSIAPDWPVGLACGIGGLLGGYVGARIQRHVPETALRILLGVLAVALSVVYAVEAVT